MTPPVFLSIHPLSSGRCCGHLHGCRLLTLVLLLHAGLVLASGCAVTPDRHHAAAEVPAPFLKGASPDGQAQKTLVLHSNHFGACPTDFSAARRIQPDLSAWAASAAATLKQWKGRLAAGLRASGAFTSRRPALLRETRRQLQNGGEGIAHSVSGFLKDVKHLKDGIAPSSPVLAAPAPKLLAPDVFEESSPSDRPPARGPARAEFAPQRNVVERILNALALLMLGFVIFVPAGCACIAGVIACPSA